MTHPTKLILDEILDRLVGKNVLPDAYAHEQVDSNAITKGEAKKAITDYFISLIGEDEPLPRSGEKNRVFTLRNQLRAELRRKFRGSK